MTARLLRRHQTTTTTRQSGTGSPRLRHQVNLQSISGSSRWSISAHGSDWRVKVSPISLPIPNSTSVRCTGRHRTASAAAYSSIQKRRTGASASTSRRSRNLSAARSRCRRSAGRPPNALRRGESLQICARWPGRRPHPLEMRSAVCREEFGFLANSPC